jgi:hypothetical protein
VAAAALVGLTLVAAGCSGFSGEGVAQVGTTNTTTSGADSQSGSSEPSPAAYAACMRENGVPSFPDPDSSGRFSGIDKRSPAVQAAQRACRHLAPGGGSLSPQQDAQLQAQLLAFAACMRTHGVAAFPDPIVANGRVQIPVIADQINPNAPTVTAATAACRITLGPNPGGGAPPRTCPRCSRQQDRQGQVTGSAAPIPDAHVAFARHDPPTAPHLRPIRRS